MAGEAIRIMVRVQSGMVRMESGLWSEYSSDYGKSAVRIMVLLQPRLWSEYSPDFDRAVSIMVGLQCGLWSTVHCQDDEL
jgi:hypothetical protein